MSSVGLILGPVRFRDFEVPPSITFGGSQRLAVHQLQNGSRIIDSMGPVDADISFSGAFSGPDATARAVQIDSLRSEGAPLSLIWSQFFYMVLIERFEAIYNNSLWIPYRISCTVAFDDTIAATTGPFSLLAAVASDVGLAAVQASGQPVDLSGVSSALESCGSMTLGSGGYRSVSSAIRTARSEMRSSLTSAGETLDSASFGNGFSGVATVAQLLALSTAAGQQAALLSADAFLGRAQSILAKTTT
jgi:hypothetical protein